jgi:hypothetical protein
MHLQEIPFPEAAFIDYCLTDKKIKAICKSLNITVTPDLLKENGIVPNAAGEYFPPQREKFYNRFSDDGRLLREINTKVSETKNITWSKAKEFTDFISAIPDLDGATETKRFLLLTLSQKFKRDVQNLRTKHGIPMEGFSTEEELAVWAGYTRRPFSHPLLGFFWSYEVDGISSKIYEIDADLAALMEKYSTPIIEQIRNTYFFYGFKNLALLEAEMWRPSMRPIMRVQTPSKLFSLKAHGWEDTNEKFREFLAGTVYEKGKYKKTPPNLDGFYIHVKIGRPDFKKHDLESFLDKYFKKIREEFDAFQSSQIKSIQFGKHWLVYLLHTQLEMNRSDINAFAKTRIDFAEIDADNFRKMRMRMAKEIKAIERDT